VLLALLGLLAARRARTPSAAPEADPTEVSK
jgi:hypothetical protein